jgi:abhydrolase domain-containing protein 14
MKEVIIMMVVLMVSAPLMGILGASQAPRSKRVSFRGSELHMLVAGPAEGRPVLLLHGARFHSGTWREIGTYRKLAEAGFHVVGLDLPGYGSSEPVEVPREAFLAELLPVLDLVEPVIVVPSMSGGFAFPFLIQHPERASGFVPVAPGGVDHYEAELSRIRIPTLILWGDNDTVIPLALGEMMASKIEGSRLHVLNDARHPCYLDRPDEFHRVLLEFLETTGKE